MKLFYKTRGLPLLILLLFGSCEVEVDSNPLVFTEEIIFVSGEILRITGRVVAAGEVSLTDHGFQIADNESFSTPIIISLGKRDIPGRFIGIYEELVSETEYFVRAYMINDGQTTYGSISPFSTSAIGLVNFEPPYQNKGGVITLYGRNFTKSSEVYFGDTKATIIEAKFESQIKVQVPNPVDESYIVPLKVITDGKEVVYDQNFYYVIGKWDMISQMPDKFGPIRNVHIQLGNQLFQGINSDGVNLNSYNIDQNVWGLTAFPGFFVKSPTLFENGFLGGKNTNRAIPDKYSEFWILDANGVLQREGDTPFAISNGHAFKIGNELWFFGGYLRGQVVSDQVYVYNFDTKTWNVHDTTPIVIANNLPAVAYKGQMYFVDYEKQLWRYTKETKSWQVISTYPGSFGELPINAAEINDGIGVTVGDFAYMGLANQDRSFWKYDFIQNSWVRAKIIPGRDNEDMIGWYSTNDKIYVLRVSQNFGGEIVLWEFDPNTL
jgi:IPT/TIG domain-containing protein/galactose oxidase-like protein